VRNISDSKTSSGHPPQTTHPLPHGVFRKTVQGAILSATLYIGFEFYRYVIQLEGTGPVTINRPSGVEGFLPIGALMAWKRFFLTGIWDSIHPAAMAVFGFVLLLSFCLRKSFCGWFCPVGALSDIIAWSGRYVTVPELRLPRWLDVSLRSVKYILMGFFLWVITVMPADQISLFLNSVYYRSSDIRMLEFFRHMSLTTVFVLSFLGVISLAVTGFWCRYFCPYGALLGLLAAIGPTRITRNENRCLSCGKCAAICPARLPADKISTVFSPECTACFRCIDACPSPDTLELRTKGIRAPWSGAVFGAVIILAFITTVTIASATGHWSSRLTDEDIRRCLISTNHSDRDGIRPLAAQDPKKPTVSIDFPVNSRSRADQRQSANFENL
jgi:polyferredoxin